MKIKLIKNYNESELTSAELSVIDYINSEPREFLNLVSIKDYCENKPFSDATFQRTAKRLGFDSAMDMKQHYTSIYIDELIGMIDFTNHFDDVDDSETKFNKLSFKSYYKNLMSNYSTVDWDIVENLIKQIPTKKCVYVYQPDQIFSFNSFDFFSHFLDIKVYRIESLYRLKLLQDSQVEKDSILIFTKAFSHLDDFEKEVLELFQKNGIEIFTITGVEGIFPREIKNNIVIGNFKNTVEEYNNILTFKIYYDPLVNMVIYNVFHDSIKKIK